MDNFKFDVIPQATEIKNNIGNIYENSNKISKLINELVIQVDPKMYESNNREILNIISETYNIICDAKYKLDKILESKQYYINKTKSTISENIYNSLIRELLNANNNFNLHHKNYNNIIQQNIVRDNKIVNSNDNDRKSHINTNNHNKKKIDLSQKLILTDHTLARERLLYYKNLHSDIIKLEKEFFELKQLFIDASILISNHENKINNIEYNVEKSKEYINDGNEELKQAVSRSNDKCIIF
jgi:t-SNARE complex subunit (syntaxin)